MNLPPSAPSHPSRRFGLYPREDGYALQRHGQKGEVMFATAQDAITHLHASRDNIGASVVVFNTAGKPIMQVQISNALLSEPPPKQNLNLDYDAEQKNFTFQREGEDRSQCFRSIKAAIAQLSSYITAEAQLTVRDAEGKPVFFATLDPNAAGLAA